VELESVDADMVPMVEIVARHVGASLDQIHLHEQTRQLAIAEDRIRLARDLHDGVLQSITGIRLELQGIATDERAQPAAATRDRLLALERALAREQRELRSFIEGLRPVGADATQPRSLASRLRELRDRIGLQWNAPVTIRVAPDLALPPELDRAVPLMVQE